MKKLLLALILLPSLSWAQSSIGYDVGYLEMTARDRSGSIRMGETTDLARFMITNRTDQRIQLNAFRIRNYGSARLNDSFEYLRLEQKGEVIGRATFTDRKSVQFKFDPVEIAAGDRFIFSVVGRLIYAKAGQTVKLGLRYREDLQASIKGVDNFSLDCQNCRGLRGKTKILRGGGIYITKGAGYRAYRYYGSRRPPNDISRYYRTFDKTYSVP